MIEFANLESGIHALANAHKAGTMAGHLGAAVVAGYFFGEDQANLPAEVFRGIEGELRRIVAGEEAIWWNVKKAGITPADLFEPLPQTDPQPESIKTLAEDLRQNVGQTRQSGHNIIFASIAIRALSDHGDFATAEVIAGVRKLIQGFNTAHAGRGYYGKETGWRNGNQVELDPDKSFPAYGSTHDLVHTTLTELVATASVRKQGFGGLWHLVNHAAAIAEMHRLGYETLAQQALPAHHHHIRLWRSLPDVQAELGPVPKAQEDPREPAYWKGMLKRDEARLTHRIKTLYGYFTIRGLIDEEALQRQADEAFLYLMA